jgi:hypothetical protein
MEIVGEKAAVKVRIWHIDNASSPFTATKEKKDGFGS